MASVVPAASPVDTKSDVPVASTSVTTDVAAEPAMKEPPPEKKADVRRRSAVVLSFWMIVILLGLPIWWKTTSIYRANLPVEGMLQWADGKVGNDSWIPCCALLTFL